MAFIDLTEVSLGNTIKVDPFAITAMRPGANVDCTIVYLTSGTVLAVTEHQDTIETMVDAAVPVTDPTSPPQQSQPVGSGQSKPQTGSNIG